MSSHTIAWRTRKHRRMCCICSKNSINYCTHKQPESMIRINLFVFHLFVSYLLFFRRGGGGKYFPLVSFVRWIACFHSFIHVIPTYRLWEASVWCFFSFLFEWIEVAVADTHTTWMRIHFCPISRSQWRSALTKYSPSFYTILH